VPKPRSIIEFGDFQTPEILAREATGLLAELGIGAATIVEPTCGRGSFLRAAIDAFPNAKRVLGVDINEMHLAGARCRLSGEIELRNGDFFAINWCDLLEDAPDPLLVIGNPPWVTNAQLGTLSSRNLPEKSNFNGHRGIDAITGKGNFDISEWMLLRYLDWLEGRRGAIAVLCKTAVARKVLTAAWKRRYPIASARMHLIDAKLHFAASVDACFFVMQIGNLGPQECGVFASLEAKVPLRTIGFRAGVLATDITLFSRHSNLLSQGAEFHVWRSGVKHDCSSVMELTLGEDGYTNGFQQHVRMEPNYLFPMLKSSDIANGRTDIRRAMIVTQQKIGEDTGQIARLAPQTWAYLVSHAASLNARGSSIYRSKPPFSIFGVGDYSFAPWKVAISGLYKRLNFVCVGPHHGKPVIFDDTINFIACRSEREASFLGELLNSVLASEFLQSMVSWSNKRPITTELLRRMSLGALAAALGRSDEYIQLAQQLCRPELPLARIA
jgi:hypothetical protein